MENAQSILSFWFQDATRSPQACRRRNAVWFRADRAFDRACAARCADLLEDAARGDLDDWAETARGRLALVILLDQMPRNIHRGTAAAFRCDAQAVGHCLAAIESGQDRLLHPVERAFLYLPLEHAEDRALQRLSVRQFEALAAEAVEEKGGWGDLLAENARYARDHCAVIERFGRFPHRNRVLGRQSTEQEQRYLASGAPTFGQ